MYPILIEIGSFRLYSYGTLIAIGILLGMQVIKRLAAFEHLDYSRMVTAVILSGLVGALCSKLLYVIVETDFLMSEFNIERLLGGGFVFYGVPLTAIPFGVWYLQRFKMPPGKVLDIVAVAFPLAHAIGRIGCFLAGCCHGKPTTSFFGLKCHSPLVDPALRGVPLHPTQLYESVSLFILFFILQRVYFRKIFDGQVFVVYVMAYSVIRFGIEALRGDDARGFVFGFFSTSQFISLILFVLAGAFLLSRRAFALQESKHCAGAKNLES